MHLKKIHKNNILYIINHCHY